MAGCPKRNGMGRKIAGESLMKVPVMLDTSFLISLLDRNRPYHNVANQYYKNLLQRESPLYFSAIVAAEIAVRQPITDLPLKNFRSLPFNTPHSVEAGRIWNLLREIVIGGHRAAVKDDIKIIAQALHEKIPFILTEEESTLYTYCERLRTVDHANVRAIKLSDGFSYDAFSLIGQTDLETFCALGELKSFLN